MSTPQFKDCYHPDNHPTNPRFEINDTVTVLTGDKYAHTNPGQSGEIVKSGRRAKLGNIYRVEFKKDDSSIKQYADVDEPYIIPGTPSPKIVAELIKAQFNPEASDGRVKVGVNIRRIETPGYDFSGNIYVAGDVKDMYNYEKLRWTPSWDLRNPLKLLKFGRVTDFENPEKINTT